MKEKSEKERKFYELFNRTVEAYYELYEAIWKFELAQREMIGIDFSTEPYLRTISVMLYNYNSDLTQSVLKVLSEVAQKYDSLMIQKDQNDLKVENEKRAKTRNAS